MSSPLLRKVTKPGSGLAIAIAALLAVTGCGGDDQPDPGEDEAVIESVLLENELGGPERCTTLYTDDYLAENWNKHVTAYGGDTPLGKCQVDMPTAGVTEDQVKTTVLSVDGDFAVAGAKVGYQPRIDFQFVRDGDGWRIDGFSD